MTPTTEPALSSVAPRGAVVPVLMPRLTAAYQALRDRERGQAMAAYMRDRFPFLGIPSPRRAEVYREVTTGLPPAAEQDLAAVVAACWDRPEREYQYFGVAYLRAHVRGAGPGVLPAVEHAITARSWWDTVDELTRHVVGPLVAAHPSLRADMDRWIAADGPWLARSAILHQSRYRDRTDADLLFAYCLRRAGDTDFFVRKAIGWALREYSKVNPDAVVQFVVAHCSQLSGLSKREALRLIGR